ncbi:MAG: hypothetical protein QM523_10135 [Candidatus Pacebacteria bacterium]|nr:hypothetical protein [Candidatus Paceibacterota bacterium]
MTQSSVSNLTDGKDRAKKIAKPDYPISKNIPNAETIKAIEETLASKNLRSFNSVAEMKAFLKRAVLADE